VLFKKWENKGQPWGQTQGTDGSGPRSSTAKVTVLDGGAVRRHRVPFWIDVAGEW